MNLLAKILLYNLSLVPLYFLFIVKKINLIGIVNIKTEYANSIFYKDFFMNNIVCFILLILIFISIFAFKKFVSETKSGNNLPQEFTEITNLDFNHLTFIATYILPLLAFTLDSFRDAVFIVFLLVFIGVIYIKTNLYYLSPVFILFGIRVYSATNLEGHSVVLLSKQTHKKIETLKYTKIGEIYFVKEKR